MKRESEQHTPQHLSGVVFIPPEAISQDKVYLSGIRPHVMTPDGLVSCEITLENELEKITTKPQRARLKFFYPVHFDFSQKDISLYATTQLLMRFEVDM